MWVGSFPSVGLWPFGAPPQSHASPHPPPAWWLPNIHPAFLRPERQKCPSQGRCRPLGRACPNGGRALLCFLVHRALPPRSRHSSKCPKRSFCKPEGLPCGTRAHLPPGNSWEGPGEDPSPLQLLPLPRRAWEESMRCLGRGGGSLPEVPPTLAWTVTPEVLWARGHPDRDPIGMFRGGCTGASGIRCNHSSSGEILCR